MNNTYRGTALGKPPQHGAIFMSMGSVGVVGPFLIRMRENWGPLIAPPKGHGL